MSVISLLNLDTLDGLRVGDKEEVAFLVSALLILGLLIYKICKEEMEEKGEI